MFHRLMTLVVLAIVATASAVSAGPAEDAVSAYRDHVAAIRAGANNRVIASVQSVPQSSKELLAISVQASIDVESVKTEMTRQMGPEPAEEEEGWNIGQMPDRVLKDLQGKVAADGTVTLLARDPSGNALFPIGLMVREGEKWVVPAG
jgi:hypothetical protein